ncbi:hypothetical protein GCM10010472_04080 [Pseudonocardia halophobica]|uniref:Uncharacterized protein n=1 Tax=Pseudonocardia halophobica TaxID=29401 RepID=A0A9W6L476_9PSEU|nr:hypothetical protein [Pseudonocardia halophobica]GLL13367.1 hypothetical protein GCM10017577_45100 [Pseudonocardia halophobica]
MANPDGVQLLIDQLDRLGPDASRAVAQQAARIAFSEDVRTDQDVAQVFKFLYSATAQPAPADPAHPDLSSGEISR